MRAKFSELTYDAGQQKSCCASKGCGQVEPWLTAEGIPVKGAYTAQDLEGMEHLNYAAGIAPFLRGPYSTMYVMRPWTIRQYAGFSTAEESNAFYRRNLAAGQKGLSVAFDLATHRGYDADHPRVVGDVGKAGVSICSVEDMKVLFNGIPLDKMSVSMTMNGAVLPILAFYIVTGLEQGCTLDQLAGTIQNDILKEFMVRNTYIYPPEFSMRIIADIFEYTSKNMPKFNSISISGTTCRRQAPRPTSSWPTRWPTDWSTCAQVSTQACRWTPSPPPVVLLGNRHEPLHGDRQDARGTYAVAKIVKQFEPRTQVAGAAYPLADLGLVAHGAGSVQQRGAYRHRGHGRRLGHTQSLHTNALDEAIALPTDFSARIARNTQIYIQEETNICREVDPWAGSYYVESLTNEIAHKAWERIQEVEKLGGMAKAIETGFRRCASRRLRPASRRVSTPARRRSSASTNTAGERGSDRHPGRGQHRRARKPDQASEGAARFARRGCREEGPRSDHRVREDQAGQSAGAGRRSRQGTRFAGRDFRRLRGCRRPLQGRHSFNIRSI